MLRESINTATKDAMKARDPKKDVLSAMRTEVKNKVINTRTEGGGEIAELALAFNQLSSDLDRATKAQRQMTADIAHDLNNPLSVIGGYVEAMENGTLQATPQRLALIMQEVHHLHFHVMGGPRPWLRG